jgi:hypothetical protein
MSPTAQGPPVAQVITETLKDSDVAAINDVGVKVIV